MTGEQLIDFFKKSKQDVCGRFDDQQLQRHIPVPPKRIPWLTYFFRITIPAFLFTAKVAAQEVIKPRIEQVEPGASRKESKEEMPFVVSGIVTDSAGKPIPHASVIVANTNIGVPADVHGRFSLKLLPAHRVLEISSVGYQTLQYAVKGPGYIPIVLREYSTLGEVDMACNAGKREPVVITMGITVISKRSKPKALKPIVEDSISIFPNPVQRNGTINIRWKKQVTSDQEVEIYTFSGSLLQKEIIPIKRKTKDASFQCKVNNMGIYIVRIKDMESGKVEARQLMIE